MISAVIKIKRISNNLPPPQYETSQAVGMDLRAAIDAPFWLCPGQRIVVPVGFAIELPDGYEAQVRPRSGLAKKHGITVLNAPGTIDPDYRDEVKVILINLGTEPFKIEREMRIAQLVIAPFARATLIPVEELSNTARGTNGLGSTGT